MTDQPPEQTKRWAAAADIVVLVVSLAAYLKTLSPSVYTFDSAELAAGAYSLGIVHATGYPLYLVTVRVFMTLVPLGDIAYRANLFSAVCAALALVVLRRVALRCGASPEAALVGTLVFGATYPFWSEAVVAEVYTLHILFVATALALALRWRAAGQPRDLVLLGLVIGLSFGNHMSTILVLPGLGVLVWNRLRREGLPLRWAAAALAAACLGPLTYLYLPVRFSAHPALNYAALLHVDLSTWAGVVWMMRGAMFANSMFGYSWQALPQEFGHFAGLLWETFLGLGVIVAALGMLRHWRQERAGALGLGAIFAATVIFYVNYRVFDKDTMFLPAFLAVSVWLAGGLDDLRERLAMSSPRAGPRRAVRWGAWGLLAVLAGLTFPRVDLSGNRITREYAEGILQELPPRTYVIGSWVDITPLEYLQVVEQRRRDVTLFDWGLYGLGRAAALRSRGVAEEEIRRITEAEIRRMVRRELAAGRPVYSLDLNPLLAGGLELVPSGRGYRVCAPRIMAAGCGDTPPPPGRSPAP